MTLVSHVTLDSRSEEHKYNSTCEKIKESRINIHTRTQKKVSKSKSVDVPYMNVVI